MTIPLPKLPTSTHPRFATDASDPPCRYQYGWLYDEEEVRKIQRDAMRAAIDAAAQAAGPDDSYRDEWFAAKADAVKRIRALEVA